ncbi:TIGR02530 family flagellar biosynthesis protein [Syntrophomonas palmitatica]|uniref:TIGR02530 family flagellar biosynthesis protein n=1 Tax=Syntrophomonas palmitatica TaxID=402877 RepID=UPI0006D1900A|nr:TIGR02530 family flagellar biosynthesis protein [Syntrophomonas palmitatica]
MTNNRIYIPQQPVQPISTGKDNVKRSANSTKSKFGQVLEQNLRGQLKFSQHAQQRLQARNIELSSSDMEKLEQAVGKAREKGSRDSLIIMNDLALLVSVKNNTVITAVDGQNIKENVFTNIDSAVIV